MGQPTFWGNPENNKGIKKGVSPTCEQIFVSLAPLFVPLLPITSLRLLENSLFLKFTSGLIQAKCGLAHFKYLKSPPPKKNNKKKTKKKKKKKKKKQQQQQNNKTPGN